MSQETPDYYEVPSSPITKGPPRGNGMAVASLVCGLLFCIPFLPSLLAVVFGIVGITKTRDPRVSGKGMAIAGLVIGVLGLGVWGVMTPFFLIGARVATQMLKAPEEFVRDLSNGNVNGALAKSAATVDRAQLVAAAEEMKEWGTLQSFRMTGSTNSNENGRTKVEMSGVAQFAKANKTVSITMVQEGMTMKISAWSFK
jgi:hypothetical protein